jgi:hypothetical protein
MKRLQKFQLADIDKVSGAVLCESTTKDVATIASFDAIGFVSIACVLEDNRR